ncbi:hypothetical protein JCM6882_007393 [Rhodosporidiobolus microsporus]
MSDRRMSVGGAAGGGGRFTPSAKWTGAQTGVAGAAGGGGVGGGGTVPAYSPPPAYYYGSTQSPATMSSWNSDAPPSYTYPPPAHPNLLSYPPQPPQPSHYSPPPPQTSLPPPPPAAPTPQQQHVRFPPTPRRPSASSTTTSSASPSALPIPLPHPPAWTPEADALLLSRRAKGAKFVDIAKEVGWEMGECVGRWGQLVSERRAGEIAGRDATQPLGEGAAVADVAAAAAAASPAPSSTLSASAGSGQVHRPWTAEERAELVELRAQGKSNAELAQWFERTVTAVRTVIRRMNKANSGPTPSNPQEEIVEPPVAPWTAEEDKLLMACRAEQLSLIETGGELGRDLFDVVSRWSYLRRAETANGASTATLSSTTSSSNASPWRVFTPGEVARLAELKRSGVGPAEITMRLGIPKDAKDAVKSMIHTLRIEGLDMPPATTAAPQKAPASTSTETLDTAPDVRQPKKPTKTRRKTLIQKRQAARAAIAAAVEAARGSGDEMDISDEMDSASERSWSPAVASTISLPDSAAALPLSNRRRSDPSPAPLSLERPSPSLPPSYPPTTLLSEIPPPPPCSAAAPTWTAEADALPLSKPEEGVKDADAATLAVRGHGDYVGKWGQLISEWKAGAVETSTAANDAAPAPPAPSTMTGSSFNPPSKTLSWTDEEVAAVIRLKNDGLSNAQAAERVGRKLKEVQNMLLRKKKEGAFDFCSSSFLA